MSKDKALQRSAFFCGEVKANVYPGGARLGPFAAPVSMLRSTGRSPKSAISNQPKLPPNLAVVELFVVFESSVAALTVAVKSIFVLLFVAVFVVMFMLRLVPVASESR